jgi:hypothetical protein
MACVLSGRPINSASEAVMFPPFVANEADPLHVFSDAVIHAEAFRAHPLAAAAQARYDEARVRLAPANRQCLICGQVVVDPEDYLGLGHLTESPAHPLYRFNYGHFHMSHLPGWEHLNFLISELAKLDRSRGWRGDALKHSIAVLSEYR